ncbi:hypothetical protein L9F63_016442, partial [Diploptera punctata]
KLLIYALHATEVVAQMSDIDLTVEENLEKLKQTCRQSHLQLPYHDTIQRTEQNSLRGQKVSRSRDSSGKNNDFTRKCHEYFLVCEIKRIHTTNSLNKKLLKFCVFFQIYITSTKLFLRQFQNFHLVNNLRRASSVIFTRNSCLKSACYGWRKHRLANPTVKAVTNPVLHGEGPHWDEETGALFFVDISSRLVNRYDPKTGKVTHAEFADSEEEGGGGVSLVVPVANSKATRLLTTDGHKVVIFNWDYTNTTISSTNGGEAFEIVSVDTESSKTGNRWNDGKADANGRLWGGTMGPEPVVGKVTPDQGSFFLVEKNNDYQPITEVTPVSISNGLAWNKDNTLLYYIDTATLQVDVFDFDLEAGTIANRRKVFNLAENNVTGSPDGMTIDNNENLWIACFGGSQIINVDPRTGTLIRSVEIPADQVTSMVFGGPNLDILYVATAQIVLTDQQHEEQPLAGSVFSVTCLGVKALAPAHNIIRTKISE